MFRKTLIPALFVLFSLSATSPVFADALQSRLDSVNQLLSVSSAAKKIQSSDSQQAKSMLEEARAMHQQAIASFEAGDEAAAKQQLSSATTTLFKAAKLADGGAAVAGKQQQDYDKRKDTVEAMLKQHQAIAEEKNIVEPAQVMEAEVLSLVAEAESKAAAGDHKGGLVLLDEAYQQVKTSVVKMRNGEQLVMSLDFATPQDEYNYYVKKVTSQRRAIDVFSQNAEPNRRKMVDSIIERADTQQSEAERFASKGDYESAVPLMDGVLNKLRSGLMMVAR